MMTTTTQSPLQDIAQAEEQARIEIEGARKQASEKIERHKAAEQKRLEESKAALKEQARSELETEKASLGAVLQSGQKQTKTALEKLRTTCSKNKSGIVSKLLDQLLTLFA